ncbi:YfiR family protein [Oceanidesulfovibrio marinus]|uniref:YfiR family protein n=1 Tax=Oceanidesulfovibrio marinus TaxID=370038 RepID=A0ABX6NGJ5_9BACT|nr:YfiR family protein [Oceanidesulfovibrio marinus]QJT09751.1 YfiR family protein [Oceanidesulfovibrio marinus]
MRHRIGAAQDSGSLFPEWLCRVAIAMIILAYVVLRPIAARTGEVRQPTEQEVKVALLYKFAKFVEWSEVRMREAKTFRICILGRNPFGEALGLLEGKQIKDMPLAVHFAREPAEVGACHIVFVGRDWAERFDEVLATLGSRGVLFVGDISGFAQRGGVLEFSLENGRVGFAINPDAARREGLAISSKLMRLARVVDGN